MHFLIIILGLSVSMASAFLIYAYVYFEKSYDSFHHSGNNLYRVIVDAQNEGKDAYKSPVSFSAQGPTALAEVPEVEAFTRLFASMPGMIVSSDTEGYSERVFTIDEYYYADDNFFEIFSFPLIHGAANQVLKNSESVVVSKTIAEKLFGVENPIGKTIRINGRHSNTITGVMDDIPENTHMKFEMIFPIKSIPWILDQGNEWTNHSFFTYLLLKDGSNHDLVEKKITASFIKENRAVNQMECVWHLQNVDDTYLQTSDFTSKPGAFKFGDLRMIYFLSIITILLLSVSWVNYINLLTAKNNERTNEVMVRKVNGADRKSLLLQFFIETTLMNLLGLILACVILSLSIHPFSEFMSFPVEIISYPSFWIIPFIILILSVLIPGLYTGLSLSQIKLGKKTASSKSSFREVMVVMQFIIIIVLVSSVLIINRQLAHISSMDLGFNKEQVLVLPIPRISEKQIESNDIETFRAELIRFPEVLDVSATTTIPGNRFGSGNGGPHIQGQQNNDTYFRIGRVMKNYPDVMNIKFVAGNSFEDSDNKLVINESAVEEFGFQNPDEILNKSLNWMGHEFTISGVTKNFHQESLHIFPEPMIMYTKDIENNFNYILIRLSQEKVQHSLLIIEQEYNSIFPGNPFTYYFLDKYFDHQYQKDIKFRMTFSFFSIIALIIGYIGLYSLTTYTLTKRIKEIGIRKVNGAKVSDLLALLNKNYIKWVSAAFVIATPIAWYAMNRWLQNFAYRTELSWWIFALAGLLAMGIALLTVSWQSWRAARRNPVEALRYE